MRPRARFVLLGLAVEKRLKTRHHTLKLAHLVLVSAVDGVQVQLGPMRDWHPVARAHRDGAAEVVVARVVVRLPFRKLLHAHRALAHELVTDSRDALSAREAVPGVAPKRRLYEHRHRLDRGLLLGGNYAHRIALLMFSTCSSSRIT